MSILTVITPASSFDLTTIETVKLELGITANDADTNNKLFAHIRQASNAIASYCDRVFGLETVSERFINVSYRDALPLRRRPISAITSLEDNESVLDSSEYYVDNAAGLIYRASPAAVPYWSGDFVVQYDAGYLLLDDLPHAIERAAVRLVTQYWFGATRDPYIRSEDIPGVASYSYGFGGTANGQLPPEVLSLLDPYRDMTLA